MFVNDCKQKVPVDLEEKRDEFLVYPVLIANGTVQPLITLDSSTGVSMLVTYVFVLPVTYLLLLPFTIANYILLLPVTFYCCYLLPSGKWLLIT